MIRSWKNICLLLAISLAAGVIWPGFSHAVQAPQLELLGEIKAGLRVPTRIDVDDAGNVYVADSRNQAVVKYDPYGQLVDTYPVPGMSGGGLAVASDGSRLFVSAQDQVICLSTQDQQLTTLGVGKGEFAAAEFIDVDRQGYVYVADLGATQIKVYDPAGSLHRVISGPFKSISSLAVATQDDDDVSNDQIYIADSFVSKVSQPTLYVYNSSGGLLRTLSAVSHFDAPIRIFGKPTFDNVGRYYFGDVERNTLHVMGLAVSPTVAGTPLISPLNEPGDLPCAIDMAFDASTSRLFVLYGNRSVKIYGVDGGQNPVAVNHPPEVPIPVSPVAGSEVSSGQPTVTFNNAIDPDDADSISYNVRVFDAAEKLVTSLNVAEQPVRTTATVDVSLVENGLYRWQVQAFDGKAESDWSTLQSFYVNAVQEAPSVPELLTPLAGAAVQTEAVLEWLPVSDADPFDTVSYLLEVASDENFNNLLYNEVLTATQRALADWSELIEPGHLYYWRITAVDNHGLATSSIADARFLYQATYLNVAANMPGARVYLGGNHGYAGKIVGEAPCKLRDLPEGRYQLVVERAGFEPFYQPVDLQLEAATQVYAKLSPAYQADKLSFKPLRVGGSQVKLGSVVTPLLADLDLDGVVDLLLTHADGSIHYYPGVLENAQDLAAGKTLARSVTFQAESLLSLPQVAGGTPCLVDWNNDYLQDLIIGSADGAVWLFLNQGDMSFTAEPILLAAVASSAVPAVGDVDGDGDKDLVVGSGDGELVLFQNIVSDATPQLAEPQSLVTLAEAAAPMFVDWNGDGVRELLIGAEGELYRAVYSAGALTELSIVEAKGKPIARVFALDIDGVAGKDVLGGTADGQLRIAYSDGIAYVDEFYPALEEKLLQLKGAVREDAAELLPLVEPMFVSLEMRNLENLSGQLEQLQVELPVDSAADSYAAELADILLY